MSECEHFRPHLIDGCVLPEKEALRKAGDLRQSRCVRQFTELHYEEVQPCVDYWRARADAAEKELADMKAGLKKMIDDYVGRHNAIIRNPFDGAAGGC